LVGKKQAP